MEQYAAASVPPLPSPQYSAHGKRMGPFEIMLLLWVIVSFIGISYAIIFENCCNRKHRREQPPELPIDNNDDVRRRFNYVHL